MFKQITTIFLLTLLWSSLYAQKSIINQGRSQARKVESEIRRTKRDFNRVGQLFSTDKKQVTSEDNLADTIVWEKKRYIPERGLVNDYAYLFRSVHGAQQKVYFKNTGDLNKIVWDSTTNKFYNRLDKVNAIREGNVVLGWHPYWMKNDFQYYKYNLLSIIAYFSYDINPRTGGYNDADAIADWRTTAMIDSAQNHNVKVLLTVTNYGRQQNDKFLSDRAVWNSLIDSLEVLLRERNGSGIDLNFEQVPNNRRDDYTDFVKKLRTRLGSSRIITVQVPAYNNNNAIDFRAMEPFVNYFIIQGYDYSYVECNNVPAPISPLYSLNTECPCIVNTYDYCIRNGLNPRKAILGLPTYGTEWTLAGNSWNAKATFERYITYNDVMSDYDVNYQPTYDAVSGSSYFFIRQGSQSSRLIWFESKESLDTKFQWALDHDMKGAAIWALGYDGQQPGIWNAIATNFGVEPLQEIRPIGYDNGNVYSIMASFVKHKRAIGIGVVIIVYFFIIGLFVSLFDWRVREIFFQNFTYRAVFAGIIIALSALSIFLLNDGSTYLFPLFVGLIIGALVVYIITTRYISYRDKLP
ncbi:Glycoside hydrolase, family 18 [Fulvivirga imtechensis AK7]|uniref:chitinase n=1 Tax=Fulvivirga imtechensis AK7 TaxID=1237149 RepID=L8JVB6_9BACT|nr:glycosyl hydrolase family 18 protein [Fulvivirga imtechensis]ELR71187.1 Glycoside hydrolase, family 18 [Fulvivirga imtechensis AK7]